MLKTILFKIKEVFKFSIDHTTALIENYHDRDWFKPATVIIIIATLLLALSTSWSIYDSFSNKANSADGSDQFQLVNVSQHQTNYHKIIDAHIFGDPATSLNATALPTADATLTLQGIFWQSDKQARVALITNSNGQAKRYVVGDILPGSAKVLKITQQDVIINKNGQYEKIEMPHRGLKFTPQEQGLF